jgi:anti-sigma-K factor RskA
MSCDRVDELAAAYALGAVDADEERAIGDHLASCPMPHAEAREAIAAATALPASLEPVVPSQTLRSRVMSTIASTPQEHVLGTDEPSAPAVLDEHGARRRDGAVGPMAAKAPRPWWRLDLLPAGLAAAGVAAVIGLGAWNVSLSQQLAQREATLRAVAAADAAFPVTGAAGSGWILETDTGAVFLADALADLPADRIYELWLIEADGRAVAVGMIDDTDGPVVAELERAIATATTFAVTVEEARVDQPTSEPVLLATLDG